MSIRRPHPTPSADLVSRRRVIQGAAALVAGSAVRGLRLRSAAASTAVSLAEQDAGAAGSDDAVQWFVTTAKLPCQRRELVATSGRGADVFVQADTPLQTIEGFGACFNELTLVATPGP